MRILHTSDLHLGITLCGENLISEQEKMADRLVETAVAEKAEAVIIAGDVFDRSVASHSAVQLFDRLIEMLCVEKNIPVIICAGNHDSPERLALHKKMLRKSMLFVEGKLNSRLEPVVIGSCAFYIVPFFNTESARAVFGEKIESYQDVYKLICDKIRENFDITKTNILVSHCFVTGGILTESDRAARLGGAAQLPAEIFSGFDYVALGHLHTPHGIGDNIRYSGTPMKYSFGEHNSVKSVTIFDSEAKKITTVPVPAERDLRVLEGSYIELLKNAENDERCDDYIKIVLNDRFAEGEIFSRFKLYYSNILSFEGVNYRSESTASQLTASELSALSPVELLKAYYLGKPGAMLGDFELEWFEKAILAAGRNDENDT
ncbi:MAG: exonuclease SbcCD subunit D [Oscillospiraceae bacterium]|jgi:exonuclease SbcD